MWSAKKVFTQITFFFQSVHATQFRVASPNLRNAMLNDLFVFLWSNGGSCECVNYVIDIKSKYKIHNIVLKIFFVVFGIPWLTCKILQG